MKDTKKSISLSDISPVCLIKTLIRNLWVVAACALIFAMGASLFIKYMRQPEYTATMTYAVTTKKTSYYPGTSVTAAKEVGAVMSELLGNDMIIDRIKGCSDRLSGFDGKITATVVANSNFLVITATASDPESAFSALRALNTLFPSLGDFLSSNSVVQLIRNPTVSSVPTNLINGSRIKKLAALAGAVLGAGAICLISVMRESVQTREGAHRLLDAPVLSVIRHERKNRTPRSLFRRNGHGLQVFSPTTSFAYAEQISSVCAAIEHEASANGRKIFLITGVGENEGKTTVAGNIAAALAIRGGKTALIDADLRKPAQGLFFDRKYNAPLPLNRLLAEPFSDENLLKCIRRHEKLGLYMLFPLKPDSRSTELITGKTMPELLKRLRRMDYVIIDSPPMGICPDAEALADLADASVLVVRQDYTPACDINDAADVLRGARAEFLGCILNDMCETRDCIPGGYGYKKKYGYGYYGYGKAGRK